LRRSGLGEVARDPERRARLGAGTLDAILIPAGDDDSRPLRRQETGRLQTDPGRRPGDEANPIAQAQIHGSLA
jgi:hypothetical protein